jgi:hypothetical protein
MESSIYNNCGCALLWFIWVKDNILWGCEWDVWEQIFSLKFYICFEVQVFICLFPTESKPCNLYAVM